MKRSIFLLFAVSIIGSNIVLGQMLTQQPAKQASGTATDLKPIKGMYGSSLDVGGLMSNFSLSNPGSAIDSSTLFFRYYIKDDLALRMGVSINYIGTSSSSVDTVGSKKTEIDSTYSRFDYYISPGIEKHFNGSDRLDPYIGASLLIGSIGSSRLQAVTKVTDNSGNSSGVDRTDVDIQLPGGFVFGLNLNMGFNLFLLKNFSLGAEYGLGFYTIGFGGDQTTVTIIDPANGSPTTTRQGSSLYVNNTVLKVNPRVAITLSYFFGCND